VLSNSTQLVFKEEEKLVKHGVYKGVHYHFLLTSGEVTRKLLLSERLPFPTPQKKYGLFSSDHPHFSSHLALFQGSRYCQTMNLEEADFIYIPIPHINGIDQEKAEIFLGQIQEAVNVGLPFLCANPDHFAQEGQPPRLVVRQGMIAHMLKGQGAEVYFIGKPFPDVYVKALQLFGETIQPAEVLMIGDTPETDIRGARQMGMASALVTKTGVMKERIIDTKAISVISQLPHHDQPNYIIERFAIYGF
jgi:HAD superfamily hydrolase (TIGR01459 family)